MKKYFLYILVLFSSASFCQVGADEIIINTITIPETALAGNNLVNWVPSDALRTFYVAADGNSSNDGLTPANPFSFDHAQDIMQEGDLFWCKAGDYGNGEYDFSNKFQDRNNPVVFIGYKNTPGDIVSLPYAGLNSINQGDVALRPVKPPKIDALPTNSVGHHLWDETEMPTFRGDQSNAPNYIVGDPVFLHSDGGEEGLILKNFQFQFYQETIELSNAEHTLFENLRFSYNGRFEPLSGQGGSNQELRGGALRLVQSGSNFSSNNVIKNCYSYNMAHTTYTVGEGQYNLIADTESYSDINDGNPQDYYFHCIGRYNKFLRTRSVRNIESRHSGHGICYNYEARYNMDEDCFIYGTSLHFDASAFNYSLNLTIVGEPDFGYFLNGQEDGNNVLPYTGGVYTFMDDANNNLVVGASFNARGGLNFQDSGAHATPDHALEDSAGHNNTVRNSTVNGGDDFARFVSLANWSGTTEARNNLILNNTVSDIDYLILTSRNNSGNVFQGNTFTNIRNGLIDFDDDDTVNSNTVFTSNNWINSDTARQQAEDGFIFSNNGSFPTIVLNGANPIIVSLNGIYTELGATANDVENGNLTVNITGTVDVSTAGTYIITYEATDLDGNTSSVNRTVIVEDENSTGKNLVSVFFEESQHFVTQGLFRNIGLTFQPEDAIDISGTVSTNNGNINIFIVDDEIIIEAVNVGSTEVTFISNDGGFVATTTVNVLSGGTTSQENTRVRNLKSIQKRMWN